MDELDEAIAEVVHTSETLMNELQKAIAELLKTATARRQQAHERLGSDHGVNAANLYSLVYWQKAVVTYTTLSQVQPENQFEALRARVAELQRLLLNNAFKPSDSNMTENWIWQVKAQFAADFVGTWKTKLDLLSP